MTKKQLIVRFRLGDLLRERGITQRKAAQLTGISKNGISVLAGEPEQFHADTLAKLCVGLDIAPGDLFALVQE